MVECHTMRHTSTAVVSYHGKVFEAELLHNFDLVLGGGPLRVPEVILTVWRVAAVAIAAEVWKDQREIIGQSRRDLMPHHMRLWVPVQQ
jgi:hypothetical protein